jgi:hypothetical protein
MPASARQSAQESEEESAVNPDTQAYAFVLAQFLALAPPLNPLAIVVTDEDTYWASKAGIHSLDMAVRYGLHPITCVNVPIEPALQQTHVEKISGTWSPEDKTIVWRTGEQAFVYDYKQSEKRPGGVQVWRTT